MKQTGRSATSSAPALANPRRRRFLRGMGGVALGLPFLEGLLPRNVRAQDMAPVKRFGVFFACNGVNMDRWFPTGDYGPLGEDHLLGTSNEVLIPHLSKLVFPRGVHMSPRGFGRDGGGADDHGKGMAHKLTAHFADDDDWLALGPSVDQVIASQINPGSDGARTPALTLGVGNVGGSRGLGYISYTGSREAVAGIVNPWNAYADFVNLNGDSEDGAQAGNRVTLRRESVLDLVEEQFNELRRGPLSSADRQKLDAHFTAIREIEMQMTSSALSCFDAGLQERAAQFEGVGRDIAEASNYATIADLNIDILALALACDYTRVASLQFDRGAGGPTFRWDGMDHEYNHHKLSHGKVRDDCFGDSTEDGCANVDGYEQMLYDIDVWHQGKFARLLERLDSYVEADGSTVLDNSAILYTNELSDGKGHSFMDLPYILAGSAGGFFRQGEYIQLGEGESWDDQRAPHNRLLNTLVNAMGIESDWFGTPEGSGGETMQGGVYDALIA